MKNGRYQFVTDCVHAVGEDIRDMLDRDGNRRISRATFARRIGAENWKQIQKDLGYERGVISIYKDWHVGYGESEYRGVPAVYLQHSAIEYIFTLDGEVKERMEATHV